MRIFLFIVLLLPIRSFSQISQQSTSGSNQVGLFNKIEDNRTTNSIRNIYQFDDRKLLTKLGEISKKLNSMSDFDREDFEKSIKIAVQLLYSNDEKNLVLLLEGLRNKLRKVPGTEHELSEIMYILANNDVANFRPSKALIEVDEAINYEGSNIECAILKADILSNSFGKSNEALGILKKYGEFASTDTERINLIYTLGFINCNKGNFATALQYAKDLKQLAENLSNHELLFDSYINIAVCCDKMGDDVIAIENYRNAIWAATRYKVDQKNLVSSYQKLGSFFLERGSFDSARVNLFKALRYIGDRNDCDFLYRYLAQYYCWIKKDDSAQWYYGHALFPAFNKKGKVQSFALASIHYEIATDYLRISDIPTSLKWANLASSDLNEYSELRTVPYVSFVENLLTTLSVGKRKYEDALVHCGRSLNVLENLGWEDDLIKSTYSMNGILSILLGRQLEGVSFFLKTDFRLMNPRQKAIQLNQAGYNLLSMGYCDESISLFRTALTFVSEIQNSRSDDFVYYLYQNLAEANRSKGDVGTSQYYFKMCHDGYKFLMDKEVQKLKLEEEQIKKRNLRCVLK